MRSRFVVGVLAVAVGVAGLVSVSPPAGGVAGFGDVDVSRFYTDAVQWMVDNDITTGTSPTCFSPDDGVTRGQAAAFMWRMEGEPAAPPHRFGDVSRPWQQGPVSWMYANGITTGTSATTYSPERTLSRGEMAALVWRLAGEPKGAASHSFVDVVAPWQQGAVSWMAAEGITTGTSPSTFSPDDTVTRGQLATFFYRYKGEPAVQLDPTHPTSPTCAQQVPQPVTVLPPTPPPPPTPETPETPETPVERPEGCVVISPAECAALATFFESTDGEGWTNKDGWNTNTNPCGWHGVTCENNSVTKLELPNNNLRGRLPTTIAGLPNLQTLDLRTNGIGQAIPTQIGNLSRLQNLSLQSNGLTGAMPTQIGNLTNLRTLNLGNNGLTGTIPTQLFSLTRLEQFDLEANNLSGQIPPWIGRLVSLEGLNLARADLTGPIPASIGELTNLVALTLEDNNLTGTIPAEIGQLTNLSLALDLSRNQLTGPIPSELGNLTGLYDLYLEENQLTGTIPPELGSLVELRSFYLRDNELTGSIPPEIGNLKKVVFLDFSNNALGGDITEAMAGLVHTFPRSISLSDGPGGNNCLIVTDSAVAAWLSGRDPNWDECEAL